MAGRARGRRDIALDALADAFARVAGAIVLDALAFIVWNVGTRPPLQLLADIRAGVGRPRVALAGCASAIVGFVFVVAATVLLVPAIADPARDLSLAEFVTILVALGVELLVGDEVRARTGIARRSR